jgi:hypothetical protein
MRKAVIMYCTVSIATVLMGATLFAASSAQATTLAVPTGLKTAIHEANAAQKVPYVCRRGSNGRECYYTAPPNRQPNANGDTPYFQKRYTGPSQYQLYPWGNPYGSR